MKRVVIIFALLVSAVTLTKAQGGGGGQMTAEQRAQASVDRIPASINLTTDQKTKILAIYMAQAPAQDSLRTAQTALRASGGDMAPLQAKRTAMTTAADTKIVALLTPEQKPAYEEYVKTRPAFGRGGQGGGGQGGQRPPQGGGTPPAPGQ